MTDSSSGTQKLCGHCGLRPRAVNHRWCKECKREMAGTYDTARDRMIEEKAFARGAHALKESMVREAQKHNPGGLIRIAEMVFWIKRAEIPQEIPLPTEKQHPADGAT